MSVCLPPQEVDEIAVYLCCGISQSLLVTLPSTPSVLWTSFNFTILGSTQRIRMHLQTCSKHVILP